KSQIDSALERARAALKQDDAGEINAARDALMQAFTAAGQQFYQAQQAEQAAAGATEGAAPAEEPAATTAGEDVVEADYGGAGGRWETPAAQECAAEAAYKVVAERPERLVASRRSRGVAGRRPATPRVFPAARLPPALRSRQGSSQAAPECVGPSHPTGTTPVQPLTCTKVSPHTRDLIGSHERLRQAARHRRCRCAPARRRRRRSAPDAAGARDRAGPGCAESPAGRAERRVRATRVRAVRRVHLDCRDRHAGRRPDPGGAHGAASAHGVAAPRAA